MHGSLLAMVLATSLLAMRPSPSSALSKSDIEQMEGQLDDLEVDMIERQRIARLPAVFPPLDQDVITNQQRMLNQQQLIIQHMQADQAERLMSSARAAAEGTEMSRQAKAKYRMYDPSNFRPDLCAAVIMLGRAQSEQDRENERVATCMRSLR